MPINAQKRKNPKTKKIKIDPFSSPVMFTIIFDGKEGLETRERYPKLVDLGKSSQKTQIWPFFEFPPTTLAENFKMS